MALEILHVLSFRAECQLNAEVRVADGGIQANVVENDVLKFLSGKKVRHCEGHQHADHAVVLPVVGLKSGVVFYRVGGKGKALSFQYHERLGIQEYVELGDQALGSICTLRLSTGGGSKLDVLDRIVVDLLQANVDNV